MKEVEIRALVNNPEEIQTRLSGLGFASLGVIQQKDIMLDKPDASLFNSGQKIRLRLEGNTAELTYKGHFEGSQDASRRIEINIPFSPDQAENLVTLFTALGFPMCFVVPKERTKFAKNGLSVTFDNWPIIGCLMEIEGDEVEARRLAHEVAPGVEFANYRLRDLFRRIENETGLPLKELQAKYEEEHNTNLGRLDLLLV